MAQKIMTDTPQTVHEPENSQITLQDKIDIQRMQDANGQHQHRMTGFTPRYADIVDYIIGITHEIWEEKAVGKLYDYYANTIERPPDGKGDNHDRYRNWQINQPVYDARGKWERMSDGEKSAFKQVAGEMLIRYSYAKDHNW